MSMYEEDLDQKWVEILLRVLSPVEDEETRQAILDYLEENPGSSWPGPELVKDAF